MRGLTGTVAWRLVLWFLILSTLPIAVMAVFVRHSVSDAFVDRVMHDAEYEARLIATALSDSRTDVEAAGVLAQASQGPKSVLLVEADGSVTLWHDGRSGGTGVASPIDIPIPVPEAMLRGDAGTVVEADRRVMAHARVPGRDAAIVLITEPELIGLPMSQIERASMVQLALSLAVVAVAGGVAIYIIIGPIQRLTDAAEALGAGDMDVRIDESDMEGEMLVLTRSFNRMADQLQESYERLEEQVDDRTRELTILNRIASVVGRSFEADEMLGDALATVLLQMQFDAGAICLVEESGGSVEMAKSSGFPPEFCEIGAWSELVMDAVRTALPHVESGFRVAGATTATDEAGDEPGDVPADTLDDERGSKSGSRRDSERNGDAEAEADAAKADDDELGEVAVVPLVVQGRALGVLIVAARTGRKVTSSEVELLMSVGHQIGVGVQNRGLHGQAKQLAILEERQRLSRDLHDSVTQSLYGVTLYAEAAARLIDSGNLETCTDHLRQTRDAARSALREMRLLIYELRPAALHEVGIAQALRTRLELVEGRSGVGTTVDIDDDLVMDPTVEAEVYRVAQEALNNALKHAQARNVRVALIRPEGTWSALLEIIDDGVGMNLDEARAHAGLGLGSMAERAAQVGGVLSIDSAPGEGTRVQLEVPL